MNPQIFQKCEECSATSETKAIVVRERVLCEDCILSKVMNQAFRRRTRDCQGVVPQP